MNVRRTVCRLALAAAAVAGLSWGALPGESGRADEAKPPQAAKAKAADEAALALTGLDPVLLTQGKQVKGSEKLTEVRHGLRYRFADEKSRAAFTKEPEKYEAQF